LRGRLLWREKRENGSLLISELRFAVSVNKERAENPAGDIISSEADVAIGNIEQWLVANLVAGHK